MGRRTVPLALALALLVGCGKNVPDAAPADNPTATDAAPVPLKIREEQKGDVTEVTSVSAGVVEVTQGANRFKVPEDSVDEYTETVLEMPDGAPRPTKLTRVYKKATRFDFGAKGPKPLGHQGKTVTIERRGNAYEFTADGKALDASDAASLMQEFSNPDKSEGKVQDLLPAAPVKVGQSWTVGPEAAQRFLSGMPFGIDVTKSKLTGTLTRTYTRDGKPWGGLTFDFDLVLDPKAAAGPKGGDASGTVKIRALVDAVIDGSAPDGTMKMIVKMNATGKEGGKETKMVGDHSRTRTIKSVK